MCVQSQKFINEKTKSPPTQKTLWQKYSQGTKTQTQKNKSEWIFVVADNLQHCDRSISNMIFNDASKRNWVSNKKKKHQSIEEREVLFIGSEKVNLPFPLGRPEELLL